MKTPDIPLPYKSKRTFYIIVGILAAMVILSRIGPKALLTPFGFAKQQQVQVQTNRYEDPSFSFEYPAAWSARDISGDPSVQNFLPGLAHVAGVGPGESVEHSVFLSTVLAPSELESAITGREKEAGRLISEKGSITLSAALATKLSFMSARRTEDRRTYYILQTSPTVVVLLHGPGDKTLDFAGEIILKTLTVK